MRPYLAECPKPASGPSPATSGVDARPIAERPHEQQAACDKVEDAIDSRPPELGGVDVQVMPLQAFVRQHLRRAGRRQAMCRVPVDGVQAYALLAGVDLCAGHQGGHLLVYGLRWMSMFSLQIPD